MQFFLILVETQFLESMFILLMIHKYYIQNFVIMFTT